MELTKKQVNITKGVAILFMLLLHLFCTKDYEGLFEPLIIINNVPLIYYFALFGDCCVAIYCFCSGYGLFIGYENNNKDFKKRNLIRIRNLYINYWIIILLFVVILGPLLGKGSMFPGSIKKLLLTITAIDPNYNGAWWFVTTYILLVLISPYINEIIKKYNNISIMIISFIIYNISYIQRIKTPILFGKYSIDLIIRQLALLGTSQFPFIIGAVFAYKKLYSKIYDYFKERKFKNIECMIIILLMIIAHGFIQTLYVAVFTGIIFICVFNLMSKPKWLNELLNYLGNHSTNLWLTHMFFYMIYFKNIVYGAKYSILIFIWLIVLCLITSYLIKYIKNFIQSRLFKFNIEFLFE